MSVKAKAGCAAGLLIGSLLRVIYAIIGLTVRFLVAVFGFFGLWIPAGYAIVGLLLFTIVGFNPFEGTLEGQLYISGFVACCVCALIISVRNLIVRPIRSIVPGFKHPVWEKNRTDKIKEEEQLQKARSKPQRKRRVPASTEITPAEPMPAEQTKAQTPLPIPSQTERPQIYVSQLDENLLVHEYSDRFELFRLNGNMAKLERIEYK